MPLSLINNVMSRQIDLTCKFRASSFSTGLSLPHIPFNIWLVVGSNPVSCLWERRGCSGLVLIHWVIKNSRWCEHSSTYQGRKEMFYLTTHSTHFIYGYMASVISLRTILIVRKETRCCHIGYSFRLAARVLLYASSHRQDITYHGPPWRIDPTTHRTMSERSYHGATSRSEYLPAPSPQPPRYIFIYSAVHSIA